MQHANIEHCIVKRRINWNGSRSILSNTNTSFAYGKNCKYGTALNLLTCCWLLLLWKRYVLFALVIICMKNTGFELNPFNSFITHVGT